MKHEALCRVKVCPHPTDPWYHVCEKCGSPAVHHHHREPKGMGGSKARDVKENIVMLCHLHHAQAHRIATAEGEQSRSRAHETTLRLPSAAEPRRVAGKPSRKPAAATPSRLRTPVGGGDAPLLDDCRTSPPPSSLGAES